MITLLTGLPGNGKTLFALWYVKKYAESQGREVYYSGIKDLMLPWTECDPKAWFDLPIGSIIVIDEAQGVFPRKPNGSTLPDYYNKLATHRHDGFDIFLITQHPSLVDNFVRELCGRHFHCIRKFGMARSTIYEWSSANTSPKSLASHKTAIPLKWSFPTEVYSYYKSAEVHTVKRSIPAKLVLAALFVLAVVLFGYYAVSSLQSRGDDAKAKDADVAASAVSSASGPALFGAVGLSGSQNVPFDPVADARAFVHMNTPRIAGLPHTAPKYDELTKPKRVPVPAMCVSSAKHCKCFTQQATPINVESASCREFASNGFFQEFDPDGETATAKQGQTGEVQPSTPAPAAPPQTAANHAPLAVFSHDPAWYKAGPSGGGGGQARMPGKGALN